MNKIILGLSICLAFIGAFFGIQTFAWSYDDNGNLISENLQPIPEYADHTIFGVTFSVDTDGVLHLNGTSTNGSWHSITGSSFTLESGTYTIQWFTDYVVPSGKNIGFGLYNSSNADLYQFNSLRHKTFTLNSTQTFSVVVWWNTSGVSFDNVEVKSMVYSGAYDSTMKYEPYGAKYYSLDNTEEILNNTYGVFAFVDSATLTYNNGSTSQTYGTYKNALEIAQLPFVSFNNYSLRMSDNSFLNLIGGNSNWSYTWYFHFASYKIDISNYPSWYFYGDCKTLMTWSSTEILRTTSGNPYILNLGDYDNQYLISMYIERRSPNIGVAYTQFGTPSNSNIYQNGYNEGYYDGRIDGISEGMTDAKSEYYQSGYETGYREGYNASVADGIESYGYYGLLNSIFSFPINIIKDGFDIDFFGINIGGFIMFILSISIVIYVVKKFRG